MAKRGQRVGKEASGAEQLRVKVSIARKSEEDTSAATTCQAS